MEADVGQLPGTGSYRQQTTLLPLTPSLMSMFANNVLLGGGVRVRVWIREQRKIKRRSKALLCL